MARKYELKERARAQEETRRRITEATMELHLSVGPAQTKVTEIARRAGVQRATVYNHFPDEAALIGACQAHWLELHPPPDFAAWAAVADEDERLERALGELFAWYEETEPMTANVLRDAPLIPALAEQMGGLDDALADLLGGASKKRRAAVRALATFHGWRALRAEVAAPAAVAAAMIRAAR